MTHVPHLSFADRHIGIECEPYIIAEIGVNHGGSLERAYRLIESARKGGADAVKFQTYKAETLASRFSPAYWDRSKEPAESQFALFKRYDSFGQREYELLAQRCADVGIAFASTPFDVESVAFLAPLMPFVKIASADITNIPLLRRVAQVGKPVLLSTGAATLDEVRSAVQFLRGEGVDQLMILHCVLSYPTPDDCASLRMIHGLRDAFPEYLIGYSDHTVPDQEMFVTTAAIAAGAVLVEKHFTDDKTATGNDHYHAMDESDLITLRRNIQRMVNVLGVGSERTVTKAEESARIYARRSIVTRRAIAIGMALTVDDIICKRPGTGIGPENWDSVIGRRTTRVLAEDEILQWSDLA